MVDRGRAAAEAWLADAVRNEQPREPAARRPTAHRSMKTTPSRPSPPKNGSRPAVVPLPPSLPAAQIDALERQRQRILHRTQVIDYILVAEQRNGDLDAGGGGRRVSAGHQRGSANDRYDPAAVQARRPALAPDATHATLRPRRVSLRKQKKGREVRLSGRGGRGWSFTPSLRIADQLVVDANGVVYANSEDGNLYAINQGGTPKSSIFLDLALGAAYTPLAIGPDGRVYTENKGTPFVIGQ